MFATRHGKISMVTQRIPWTLSDPAERAALQCTCNFLTGSGSNSISMHAKHQQLLIPSLAAWQTSSMGAIMMHGCHIAADPHLGCCEVHAMLACSPSAAMHWTVCENSEFQNSYGTANPQWLCHAVNRPLTLQLLGRFRHAYSVPARLVLSCMSCLCSRKLMGTGCESFKMR